MHDILHNNIASLNKQQLSEERITALQPLISYINDKLKKDESINLNFICTHNSRRSHLCQIWAQTLAYYFNIDNLFCYSGGTEATALYPKIVETLINQGFQIHQLSNNNNPVYAIKFSENALPIICFSKVYNHSYNPNNNFVAILTCNDADNACPTVYGATARFPIKYNDPKLFDNTPQQSEKYIECSTTIAQELYYVFKQIGLTIYSNNI